MSTNTAANVQSPPTTSRWKGSTVRSLFVRRRLRDLIVKNIDKIEELFAFSTGKYIEPNTGYKRTLFNKTRKQAVTEDKKPLSTLFRLISQLIPSKKVDTGLKEQIENTNQGDSIWAKIKSGKVDEVKAMIDNNPNVIHERGSVGELPIHLCFIFNSPLGGPQDQMAWYMIDKDPSIIRGVYDSDKCTLYTGENVLHIAIVNQRFDLVKKLITENPRLLEASATGDFFQVGKPCYFGEFPLAFAATTNQIEIFDYLLEAGANMDREDSNGNNLLHMLVIHSLPDLYTHVYKKWVSVFGEDGRGVKVPLWQRPNKNGFTPFKLCAELGLKDMFNYLIEDRKIIQWSYGPVTCMIYPLDELDFEPEDETPPTLIPTATDAATSSTTATATTTTTTTSTTSTTNTISPKTSPRVNLSRKSSEKNLGGTWRSVLTQAQEKKPSALELIINNYHFDLLENIRIENLIEKKWEGFAKDIVMTRFIAVIFNLIILTAFTIVRESILDQQTAYTTRISTCAVADTYDINTCAPHLLSTDGITAFETNIFYVLLSILLFFAAYKGYKEFTEMCNDFLGYFSQQGSALLENLVSSTYCLSIFIFTTFYTFDIPLQQLFLAIASMAGYLYLFFFLLTFETTGPMVVMVYRMLEQDVFRFVLIFLVFLLGFSQAFFVLDDNTTFIGSLSSCFEALLGDFEVKKYMEAVSPYRHISSVLLISYIIVVSILLFNLLIAMMGNTYTAINEEAKKHWQLQKCRTIFSIQSEMSKTELKNLKYFVEINKKRYLEVMFEDPNHFKKK